MEIVKTNDLKLNSDSVRNSVQVMMSEIESGNLNPLEVFIECHVIKKFTDALMKVAKDRATEEAHKYAKGESAPFGVGMSIRGGRTELDYDQDEEYGRLKQELKARKDLLDMAYKSKGKAHIADPEGEEVPVVDVKKIHESSLAITY